MTKKHPDIAMCDCVSSQVSGYGYDEASKTLAVKFKGGGTYHYANVPPDLFEQMGKAESVGRFIHQNIKGQFDHAKVGG